LDMLNGLNFSNLNNGSYYRGWSNLYVVDYYNGESDAFWGYGFTYDYYGNPTGAGTVTDFEGADAYGYLRFGVYDINVPVSSILNASQTYSAADDLNVIKAALAGADTIYGSDYADVLDGFNGNDTIYGYAGNDTLYGESGNDYLNGNGNDKLSGGVGADNMQGGAGNDTYYVDNRGDVVVETSAGGTSDSVATSVSYALSSSAYVEKLSTTSLAGTTAINLTGNGIAQTITGNAGKNILNGAAGNDTLNGGNGNDFLYGGLGNDRLTGGAGYDGFVFNTKISSTSNVDTITDFNPKYDTIRLDNAVMSALGSAMESGEFWKSTTGLAHDSSDRIIYETDTGWLNYDSNGNAAGGSVHIAKLAPNLALTYADFLVI
jgi:Ca2+-binding RTX toxin-like protein